MPDSFSFADRPNILLIHADQHRSDCLGVAGHPFLKTPNLDRLASEGIRFTNAFTPCPVCTPARNSLMYGCWPTQHGAIANHNSEAPPRATTDGLRTWSENLSGVGYRMRYVGKWGVRADRSPLEFGFDTYIPESDYEDWRQSQGLPRLPGHEHPSDYFGSVDTHATEAQSRPARGADQTIRLMTAAAKKKKPDRQPFLIRWDPSEPHPPAFPPEPFASLYPPESIPPWPNFVRAQEGEPLARAALRRVWGIEGREWKDWQPIVARTLGIITLLDRQIGRVLGELDRLGLAENTLVIYTADHGDMLGSHGLFDKHYSFYDEIVRVPLIVRWPRVIPSPGSVSQAFVSNEIDLATTLCEVAGAASPGSFAGQSLLPILSGEDNGKSRDMAFSQYFGTNFGLYSSRMARDSRWKYVWNPTDIDELYSLGTAVDPGELVNRIDDPSCATELQRLRHRLVEWMEKIGDPLLNKWTRPGLVGVAN